MTIDMLCGLCHEQKERLKKQIARNSGALVLGALGPQGTTSYEASLFFSKYLNEIAPLLSCEIKLWPNFDKVIEGLRNREARLIVLPNPYGEITKLYWDDRLEIVCTFTKTTPQYGIASHRNGGEYHRSGKKIKVTTCKAVEHLLPLLWSTTPVKQAPYEIISAYSTTESLKMVMEGEADFAVTNATSVERSDARFVSSLLSAEVLWTVFGLKERD